MPHVSPAGAALSATDAHIASTGTVNAMPVPGVFMAFPAATQVIIKRVDTPVVDAGSPEVPPKPVDPNTGGSGSGSGESENGGTGGGGTSEDEPGPNQNQGKDEDAAFTASVNTLASELATATNAADTASLVSKYASYATDGLSLVSKYMSCTSAASAAQTTHPGAVSSSAVATATTSGADLNATCRVFLTLADNGSPTHTSNAGVRTAFATNGRNLRLKILLALLPFLAGGLLVQQAF